MKYSSVHFTSADIQDWQKDLLIAELAEVGFDTFEDSNTGFVAYIPTSNLDVQVLETVLLSQVDDYHIDYSITDIEEQNWNALWERNFQPITVDDKVFVRATFHEAQPGFDYEIVIDPKMSFGTGHHQTTAMMLSFILENDFEGKRVLDMGCGTGILAILAAKKGAKELVAIDFDPICVDSVRENMLLNGVDHVEERLGSSEAILPDEQFDNILANINRNILLDQLDVYAQVLVSGGELYLSGFYVKDDLAVIQAKCAGLSLIFKEHKEKDSWCAARFVKK